MAFALITGASGGIGLSIARELAKQKIDLLLVARSTENLLKVKTELEENNKIKVEVFSVDLSLPGSAQSVAEWVERNSFPVNMLVNNAGYGVWGSVDKTPLNQLTNMMQLNMASLTEMCHLMLPELKKHGQSYIMNIASTAAYQAVPTLSTYAATKSYVLLFTRGLRRELINTPVSVTCVSPGATSTGFVDRAGMSDFLKDRAEKFSMKADDVAKVAVRGMFNKKAEVIPGLMNQITVLLTYFVPKRLTESIAEGLYKSKS
ncbi:MAG: SDR family oxidoreductase [Bacteroidetes bacterium]|nr:SDR family oxidoreductase [Bacteroidota bacterium]